jgi:hypothetical protein
MLLTPEIRDSLPRLGATRDTKDPIVYAKYITPAAAISWYVCEGGFPRKLEMVPVDYTFFGIVEESRQVERKYFTLKQLEQHHPEVIRDERFRPAPLSVVMRLEGIDYGDA